MKFCASSIESLEPRIAPASASISYTDFDGDRVKITISKPGATPLPLSIANLGFIDDDTDGQLRKLSLLQPEFDGVSVIFTVKKSGAGDGLAHVGYIDAYGSDLVKVVIPGDLGRIDAGNVLATDAPMKLLQVRSLGAFGLVTQEPDGHFESVIVGGLDVLKVKGDFINADLTVGSLGSVTIGGDFAGMHFGEGNISAGVIGKVTIRGDLLGLGGENSGRIVSTTTMGSVRIGGDLVGGHGYESGGIRAGTIGNVWIKGSLLGGAGVGGGEILASHSIKSVRIGGSIVGGPGAESGVISAHDLGTIHIGGDIIGGTGEDSGTIVGGGTFQSVRIGGDIVGGKGEESGQIISFTATREVRVGGNLVGGEGAFSGQIGSYTSVGNVQVNGDVVGGSGSGTGQIVSLGTMGHIRIGGDLIGGSIAGDASLFDSGEIYSVGSIASVTLGGSLIAGRDASNGTLLRCGAIIAGDDLGPVTIGGGIVGNETHHAQIIAEGQQIKPTSGFDVALASLTVRGDVSYATILAGYNLDGGFTNADASTGSIRVGGHWTSSILKTRNWTAPMPQDTALVARITSLTIQGGILFADAISDAWILTEQIDRLQIGSRVTQLAPGPGNDIILLPSSTMIFARELNAL